MERLITPQEVADLLRRPRRSIYEMVKAGLLTAIRDGRRLKFRLKDLEKYISDREYRAINQD